MRRQAFLLGIVLGLSFAGAVFAQVSEKEKAKEHFDRGVKFFKEGKFQDALMDFESSYHFRPHWMLLFNIASCHYELGNHLKAAETISSFLAAAKGETPEEKMKLGIELLASVKKKLGVLKLTWADEAPAVTIDGNRKENLASGQDIFLHPGSHVVMITAGGKIVVNEDIVLEEGTEKHLDIASLAGEGAAGEEGAPGPPEKIQPEEEKGETAAGAPAAAEKKKKLKQAAWATLALGAGLLAGGAVTAGLSWNQKEMMLDSRKDFLDAYDDRSVSEHELEDMEDRVMEHRDKGRELFVASAVLFAAGGVLAAAAAVTGILSLRRGREKAGSQPRLSFLFPGGSLILHVEF